MSNTIDELFGAIHRDVTVDSLTDQIAYYKSMLAEAARRPAPAQTCLTPEMLQERLGECERQLAQLQGR